MGKSNLTETIKNRNNTKITKESKLIPLTDIDNIIESKIDISKIVPAPEDWNIFEPIDDNTMAEMMFSIIENGLIHPIVIWEYKDQNYMVLSGHNRLECYKKLYEQYEDPKYLYIESKIIPKKSIDEQTAKEIVIDSNYIQRKYTSKTLHKLLSIKTKIIKDRTDKKGRKITDLAKEMKMSARKLYEEIQILDNLIDEIKELYYQDIITRRNALKITTMFKQSIQKYLIKNYEINDVLIGILYKNYSNMAKENQVTLNQLRDIISENDIEDLIEENKKKKMINIKVPQIYEDEIKKIIEEFLIQKEKINE